MSLYYNFVGNQQKNNEKPIKNPKSTKKQPLLLRKISVLWFNTWKQVVQEQCETRWFCHMHTASSLSPANINLVHQHRGNTAVIVQLSDAEVHLINASRE